MAQALVRSGPRVWWQSASSKFSHRRPRPEMRDVGRTCAPSDAVPETRFCRLPAGTGDCAACDRFPCDDVTNLLASRQGPLVWLLLALGGSES